MDAVERKQSHAKVVVPENFDAECAYYNKVLNAQRHPLVQSFMSLSNKVIASRYCHLHPSTDEKALLELLKTPKKFFRWAGADLFSVTDDSGKKQMIIIETNSCPSGNKSLPLKGDYNDGDMDSNYHRLIRNAFWPVVEAFGGKGELAVVYDKNEMECAAYAAALADVSGEKVYLTKWKNGDRDPPAKIENEKLFIRDVDGEWIPIRAAYRYVTQKPWNRIPTSTSKTLFFNPVVCCLAGGRNKMCADKAYEFFNHKNFKDGLAIRTPITIRDVQKREVPIWVKSMGGFAVVKNPYSNAGQGVYTVCSPEELKTFMDEDHHYDKFIVQGLVGNSNWSSNIMGKKYYHTGTIPNRQGHSYCADLRMMVYSGKKGFRVCSMYARRAAKPLTKSPPIGGESWGQLGTNLSIKLGDNKWDSDTRRLLLMDSRDFNKLGLGLDDLIDGYIQTVCAVTAIDDMAKELINGESRFDMNLYSSLCSDKSLLDEIIRSSTPQDVICEQKR
mmetsp:Transcript_30689/g.53855  ORF Transcript_30689/g.53855 Transcript_30689/m.53855 type:complete len:501 (-) Transcript_30689:241-1743(-)|eukprot:CAMPEP_0197520940 /NCGR_PEP_ID=MMETSP1318-20131121/6251_1 /TAXON_ID=552666 /ORGANISM="Partenskyella glossopodia, Strain RCC365" /LENGTH=500 /DNA_ID=CAMNT_0043072721 /DNA_START=158 /DNA_END=1660 /DNA_ORIENTATION=+